MNILTRPMLHLSMPLFVLFLLLSSIVSNAQNHVMEFDGSNDYINLGTDAGEGIRTIELWFKLENPIDSTSLSEPMTLVSRNSTGCNECTEFNLTFTHSAWPIPGSLQYTLHDSIGNNPLKVYSNQRSWSAGRWYHVAAVNHPSMGMLLFIDGILQDSINASGNFPTTNSTFPTSFGRWGDLNIRHFEGRMDDVRFSSNAVYSANFTPPCPDNIVTNMTIGMWHFEGTGSTAIDSSANGYDGVVNGCSWVIDTICESQIVVLYGIDSVVACDSFTWMNGQTYIQSTNTPMDTLLSSMGFDSIVTLNLVINTVDPTFTDTNGQLIANDSGATYQWLHCDDILTPIPGETLQIFTPSATGSYALVATKNGCTDTSDCEEFIIVGNEYYMQTGVRIFPNPATKEITIQIQNGQSVEVLIYSASGALVNSGFYSSKSQIDCSSWNRGIYFIELRSDLGLVTRNKLVLID